MLYDKRWDAKTKPPVISALGLLQWLETKPPAVHYDFHNCDGECLLAQYLTENGVDWSSKYVPLADAKAGKSHLGRIACEVPWTFGDALQRLKSALG